MQKIISLFILGLLLLTGCSNRDAALFGGLIGRSLGKPLGTVATAVDETFNTTGDIVKESPRYQQRPAILNTTRTASATASDVPHYYRAEVIVKTRGPAEIENLELQKTEDVSEFWR